MRPSVRSAGQETGKLAPYADYYVVNDITARTYRSLPVGLVDLFLGGSAYSQPTADERRMHLAFSASHGSACLSRHVGAALFNSEGDIIGLGHNDVPKAVADFTLSKMGTTIIAAIWWAIPMHQRHIEEPAIRASCGQHLSCWT